MAKADPLTSYVSRTHSMRSPATHSSPSRGRAIELGAPLRRGGTGGVPVGRTDQHDDAARRVLGQPAGRLGRALRLLRLWQQREDVRIEVAVAPEMPVMQGDRSEEQGPQQ